jgi:iron complex transport system substrate-binding protein
MHSIRFAVWLLLSLCVNAQAATVERIVSLAPNLTELAFVAGAGSRVVGTVEYSDEPAAAREIPRIGDAFRVDVERILALRPNLVLAWQSGTPRPTIERLRALGLDVREFQTQRIADVPRVVRELGEINETQAVAAAAAISFEQEMSALSDRYAQRTPLRVFLQVNSRPLYTVTGRQIMSELLTMCGGRNVFDDLGQLAPQVALEAVIARNPDVIVITDDGNPNAVNEWRKWSHVEAVRTNNLFTLPANDLTRATTRLTHGAAALCRVLETARARKAQNLGIAN